jgi:hypothetical protein
MASDMVQLSLGKCDCVPSISVWLSEKKNPCITWTDVCYASMHSFDHFHIIRQGLLLSIDTFGVSHILPILSLPFIAMVSYNSTSKDDRLKNVILNNITQVLYMATLTIKTNVCTFSKRLDVQIEQMNWHIIHFVNIYTAKFKLLNN